MPKHSIRSEKPSGMFLRVDTHTESEARGKFARLCIQIDVTKLLVTAIRIEKFEQPMCYEGIQKQCFDCGRMGHKRENCPYSIHRVMTSKEAERVELEECNTRSRSSRRSDATKAGEGLSEIVHENV